MAFLLLERTTPLRYSTSDTTLHHSFKCYITEFLFTTVISSSWVHYICACTSFSLVSVCISSREMYRCV